MNFPTHTCLHTDLSRVPFNLNGNKLISGAVIHCSEITWWNCFWNCRREISHWTLYSSVFSPCWDYSQLLLGKVWRHLMFHQILRGSVLARINRPKGSYINYQLFTLNFGGLSVFISSSSLSGCWIQKENCLFCGWPKGHIAGFGADPKGTLEAPKGTVPFGIGLARTLGAMSMINLQLNWRKSQLIYAQSLVHLCSITCRNFCTL